MKNNYEYVDFYSFESLMANSLITDKLIAAYQDVFADPLLWNETYTRREVFNNLRTELSAKAGIRLCFTSNTGISPLCPDSFNINPNKNNQLIGFCWAQVLHHYEIEKSIQSVRYYQQLGSPELKSVLKKIVGDEPVIYLHDLGISKQHRGQVSLKDLIHPVLESLADKTQTGRLLFWSIADSRIYRLAQRAGYNLAAEINGMQFFTGDIQTTQQRYTVDYKNADKSAVWQPRAFA